MKNEARNINDTAQLWLMQFGQGEITTKETFSSQHHFQQAPFYYLSATCASADWQKEHKANVQMSKWAAGDGSLKLPC